MRSRRRCATHSFPTRRSSDLKYVGREPTLRALAGCAAVTNFAGWVFLSVYIVYMKRELGLGATSIGLVFAAGDRKSTRLNSSHRCSSYAVSCLQTKKNSAALL